MLGFSGIAQRLFGSSNDRKVRPYKNRVGETYSVTYNPAHRWYYAPELRRDEALLLKIMDSKTDGRARFMPHTSFADPNAPANMLPRESIGLVGGRLVTGYTLFL